MESEKQETANAWLLEQEAEESEEGIMSGVANEEEGVVSQNAMKQEAAMRKMELAENMKKRSEEQDISVELATVEYEEDSEKTLADQFDDTDVQVSDSVRRFRSPAEENPEKRYDVTDESTRDIAWEENAKGTVKIRKAGFENASKGRKREKQDATVVQEQEEFARYVAASLCYPEDARLEGVEGEVVLGVYLNKKGRVSHLKLLQKLSQSCDREAIRLLEEYKGAWSTEKRHFTVVVPFRLDREVSPSSGS